MITCKFCNANCDDDMNYCYICGTKLIKDISEPEPTPVVEPIPESEPTPVVEPIPESEPTPVVEPIPEPEPAPREKGKKVLSAFLQATEWLFAIFGMIFTIVFLVAGNVVSAFVFLLSAFMISPLAERKIPFLKGKGAKAFFIQIVIALVLVVVSAILA